MTNRIFPLEGNLSKTILKPEEIILPIDTRNGCVLEIGFGNGEYTAGEARNAPQTLFVGIEVSHSCVMRALKRAKGIENIRFMSGDARFLMREVFSDCSLDRVQMNFPCPWPKERHAKRRVTSSDFADTLAAVLKIDGYFELMTDDETYAAETRSILGNHCALKLMSYEQNPLRPVTTKYERKWLAMDRNIWRVRIKKKINFTVERLIKNEKKLSEGKNDMHIRLDAAKIENLDSLFDSSGKDGDSHWIFKRHFSRENIHLIETVSSDSGFEQKYYLKVVKEPERALIKIDGNSSVFLTPSVRYAIADLAEKLK